MHAQAHENTQERGGGRRAIDPVCGMTVLIASARHRAEHAGRTYLFCNPRCREKFLVAPERYLDPVTSSP